MAKRIEAARMRVRRLMRRKKNKRLRMWLRLFCCRQPEQIDNYMNYNKKMRKRFDEISLIIVTMARVWEGKKKAQKDTKRERERGIDYNTNK